MGDPINQVPGHPIPSGWIGMLALSADRSGKSDPRPIGRRSRRGDGTNRPLRRTVIVDPRNWTTTLSRITPTDFRIAESGVWFFSLLWEYGKDAPRVEFLDNGDILAETASE